MENYWNNREELSKRAKEHIEIMKEKYPREIQDSISRTEYYDSNYLDLNKLNNFYSNSFFPILFQPEHIVEKLDTVSAIFKYSYMNGKMVALNFASFKNPGGMFLKGSSAQEESLCHESTLYNVISCFDSCYYENNRSNTNRALYYDRSMYSPDIVFERNGKIKKCDIITCAAPNRRAAIRYKMATEEENYDALVKRISHILNVALLHQPNILILGAFGCGVFGQSAEKVASIFYDQLTRQKWNPIQKIIYAIPGGKNFEMFKKVIH